MFCPIRCIVVSCLAILAISCTVVANADEPEPSDRPPSLPASLAAELPSPIPASREIEERAPLENRTSNENRDSAPESPQSVLVLRTGGVLKGRIERSPDYIRVTTARGEIQVRARDVEFICRDLSDAYSKKRAAMFGGSAAEHIRLAGWCLRHELPQNAAREILDARRIDARHPRLEAAERRLKWVMSAKKKRSPARPSQSAVVQAAFSEQVTKEDERPGNGHRLPVRQSVIETFTSTIQPLLLNRCTNSGCHQIGGRSAYQLDRLALRRASGRRSTLRNLEATLAWVHTEIPESSRLLLEARSAHGAQTTPALSGRHAELYEKLEAWVRDVGGKKRAKPSEKDAAGADVDVSQKSTEKELPRRSKSVTNDAVETARDSGERPEGDTAEDRGPFDEDVPVGQIRHGAGLRAWQPKDAFDPEQFNRQVRGSRLPDGT